jgi:hypothetical protein
MLNNKSISTRTRNLDMEMTSVMPHVDAIRCIGWLQGATANDLLPFFGERANGRLDASRERGGRLARSSAQQCDCQATLMSVIVTMMLVVMMMGMVTFTIVMVIMRITARSKLVTTRRQIVEPSPLERILRL